MSISVTKENTALMAHLLRRAGFGATRQELEQYLEQGYEAVVESLLHPGDPRNTNDDTGVNHRQRWILEQLSAGVESRRGDVERQVQAISQDGEAWGRALCAEFDVANASAAALLEAGEGEAVVVVTVSS